MWLGPDHVVATANNFDGCAYCSIDIDTGNLITVLSEYLYRVWAFQFVNVKNLIFYFYITTMVKHCSGV